MNRIKARALVAAAGCLATALIPNAAQAGPAPRHWIGGGIVATPPRLRTVAVTVVAPQLRCPASSTAQQVQIGVFGTRDAGSRKLPWSVALVATCVDGVARYRAKGLRVHPGDVLALWADVSMGQQSWEVEDRTTGQGVGGGSGSAGGPHASTAPWVLIGGQVTGRLPATLTVPVSRVRVDKRTLGNQPIHHRAQLRRNNRVVRAGQLNDSGTGFPLRVG